MRGGEAVQPAAGEGMTRGQYLPGGAAQQDVKGQPSALVTAPLRAPRKRHVQQRREPRGGEACPSRPDCCGIGQNTAPRSRDPLRTHKD